MCFSAQLRNYTFGLTFKCEYGYVKLSTVIDSWKQNMNIEYWKSSTHETWAHGHSPVQDYSKTDFKEIHTKILKIDKIMVPVLVKASFVKS